MWIFCVNNFIFALQVYRLYFQTSWGYIFVGLLILLGCLGFRGVSSAIGGDFDVLQ